ncbi:hypothetical protein D1007_52599 [Hordeum vulgare]|nr:hypothetical protein D1007_52599 [Hordeum vulgare]
MCRLVMANYEPDLAAPLLDPSNVVRRRTYADTGGRVTPYLLYLDLGRSGASTSAAMARAYCAEEDDEKKLVVLIQSLWNSLYV